MCQMLGYVLSDVSEHYTVPAIQQTDKQAITTQLNKRDDRWVHGTVRSQKRGSYPGLGLSTSPLDRAASTMRSDGTVWICQGKCGWDGFSGATSESLAVGMDGG